MIQLFKMAFRDLGRNRRRSILSALALGMGLALLLLMAATVEGEMQGSLESSIRLASGHLQLSAKSYDENTSGLSWDDLIENPTQLSAQIATLQHVKAATPRLFASGMVAEGAEPVGVRILGIDPPSPANDPFRNGIVSGEYIQADDRSGVLVGMPLAAKLNLKAGDNIYLLVNTSGGDIVEQDFVIRGIFTTGTPAYDKATLLMPLDKAQGIAQAPNHASIIFVLLDSYQQTPLVAAALKDLPYQVKTYEEMNSILVQTEALSKAYMSILYLIILAITASVIVNTLVMAVFERTREIGILAAMGMKSTRIMAMFFAESSLLAVGGILMGLALGGLMVAYATWVGFYIGDFGVTGILLGERIYASLTFSDTITITLMAFIITLLAALYPALLAARMEPVDALRGGK